MTYPTKPYAAIVAACRARQARLELAEKRRYEGELNVPPRKPAAKKRRKK